MASGIEIERKYEVPVGFSLPDLTSVSGVAVVTDAAVHDLDAVYYDTADLRLATNRMTLRRRTGGHDAGWHLKRPAGEGARRETQLPLGDETAGPPPEIAAQISPVVGDAEVAPVVRLRTRRLERALRAGDGTDLALVADDTVTSEPLGATGAPAQQWRELEVELVDGSRDLLAAVEEALRPAGARPATSGSKLARALSGLTG